MPTCCSAISIPVDFCGGRMRLETAGRGARPWSRRSARRSVSMPSHAAHGIYRLVNANMANAIRRVAAQRGVDPRGLTMVAYGGNGPVHATAQAEELGIATVLVPKVAPAFSALGLQLSDHLVDEMRAYIAPVRQVDLARVNALFAEMEAAARAVLGKRRGPPRVEAAPLHEPLLSRADVRHGRAAGGEQRPSDAAPRSTLRSSAFMRCTRSCIPTPRATSSRSCAALRLTLVGVTEKPQLPTFGRSTAAAAAQGPPPRVLRRPLRQRAGLRRRARAGRPPHRRPGDHRGTVHDDRPAPAPARDARPLRQLPHRGRVIAAARARHGAPRRRWRLALLGVRGFMARPAVRGWPVDVSSGT